MAAVNTQAAIDQMREIVEEDDGLKRHGAWLRRCLANYIGSAGEGKTLEKCFGIHRGWRNKERLQKRNQAIRELVSMLESTNKAKMLNGLVDDYLNGNYRHDYVYGLPTDADEQRRLLFAIVKGGVIDQRQLGNIINEI